MLKPVIVFFNEFLILFFFFFCVLLHDFNATHLPSFRTFPSRISVSYFCCAFTVVAAAIFKKS